VVILWIYGMYDSYKLAKEYNHAQRSTALVTSKPSPVSDGGAYITNRIWDGQVL